jgi:hypothetical protein
VKGVLTAEDGKNNTMTVTFIIFVNAWTFFIFFTGFAARLSVQAGAAGIIVSNHGARQLDYVPSTIMALEEVIQHVSTWNIC